MKPSIAFTLTLTAVLSSTAFAQQTSPSTGAPPASTSRQEAAPSAAPTSMDLGSIFDRLNTSHTGKLTKAEAQAHPTVASNFDSADTNHDGVLTKDEFLAAFKPAQ